MSALHIDFIIGNHDNLRDENKPKAVAERQPLPRQAENPSKDILESPLNLPESLAESIKKNEAGESAQR